jgi:thymidine kinase
MLTLTLGCMYAGKTSALIKHIPQEKYIVIDYDRCKTPYLSELKSHDDVRIPCMKSQYLMDIDVSTVNTILINEAQFFSDILSFVETMKCKNIHIYGLDGDFKQEMFGNILSLIPKSDSYVKLYATCICGNQAAFSKRLSTNLEQYSPDDTYRPSCRSCLIIDE